MQQNPAPPAQLSPMPRTPQRGPMPWTQQGLTPLNQQSPTILTYPTSVTMTPQNPMPPTQQSGPSRTITIRDLKKGLDKIKRNRSNQDSMDRFQRLFDEYRSLQSSEDGNSDSEGSYDSESGVEDISGNMSNLNIGDPTPSPSERRYNQLIHQLTEAFPGEEEKVNKLASYLTRTYKHKSLAMLALISPHPNTEDVIDHYSLLQEADEKLQVLQANQNLRKRICRRIRILRNELDRTLENIQALD